MKRYNISYFFKEGISGVWSHGFMSFASVSVIITCLVLTGSIAFLVLSLNQTIASMGDLGDIRAYVDETFSDEEVAALETKVRNISNVSGVDFIDRDRGLQELKEEFGEEAYLLDGLEYDNPIRHSFRIVVMDIDKYDETLAAVESLRGIATVHSSKNAMDALVNIKNVLQGVSVGFVVLLGMVSVFLISNTIKLATFDRREEIGIMKMIGATDAFIRAPFIIESIIISQIAAGIAFILQWIICYYISGSKFAQLPIIEIAEFSKYMFLYLIAYMVTALVIGVTGSVASIRKFLRV
ncbi:MAG: ABC transporter permease [Clostridiales bacterium]|nr:ABC transporter permease [Clostridiales bacterium]